MVSTTECFRPPCTETVYRESAYIHKGRLFCGDTCQQWYDADNPADIEENYSNEILRAAKDVTNCHQCDRKFTNSAQCYHRLHTGLDILFFCELECREAFSDMFFSYPCHKRPSEKWCDSEGVNTGGFMGHTCQNKVGSMTISTTSEEKDAAVARSEKRADLIKPDYYHTTNVYEPFKIIRYYGLNFFEGNALKYLLRAGKKKSAARLEDLQKALTYIDSEIKQEKEKQK